MFDFNSNVFDKQINIPDDCKVVFVSDAYVESYVGGAELTSQALIDACPFEIFKLHSKDVTLQLLQQGSDKFWIFGNFTGLNPQLIPSIVGNLKYSIIEYDYKYCRVRSPEKHLDVFKMPCDCHNQMNGKIVSAFFFGSMHNWWMSERQKEKYLTLFTFLAEKNNTVLSSVFDDQTLGLIKALRTKYNKINRTKWVVLGSTSWIKGVDIAKQWCIDNQKEFDVVWNIPYEQFLEKLAVSEGLVYLPLGGDTCPRMIIEAKLLGCKLHMNDNVQHADEEWFATNDIQAIEEYLYTARKTFWNGIKIAMDYKASISGYTTTLNCVKQQYPFEQSIKSMLTFCDEVCVVDGGSSDETWNILTQLASNEPRLIIKQNKVDTTNPKFAVFDGKQKALARLLCTKEFCWQMDSDEIVHEDDAKRIPDLCRSMPSGADILALPVIEYWGGPDKVRLDIQPWKWRLSRNKPNITHGIPKELRLIDENGELYAAEGTDGCDMIDSESFERLPHISFYTPDVENARRVAMLGNEQARLEYEQWFNQAINGLPSVFHYSWYDLGRKIRLYRDYWSNHWNSLYGKSMNDTVENNMMFDVPWSQVTEQMIDERAELMANKLGGWIWHRKWDGKTSTGHITINRSQPKIMMNVGQR